MSHWAAPYIGLGYAEVGRCWGLVQRVFRERHGIEMPAVAVGEQGNEAALVSAARVSGWRPVAGAPAADDIVLMRGKRGRHVGVMTHANGTLVLLHAIEDAGVCAQPLADLVPLGYGEFEFWRRTR